MFQILSRTCFDSTNINKQVDYYLCVCYHKNLTLYKNRFNKFPLFDDDKPKNHTDMKGKHKLVPNQLSQGRDKFWRNQLKPSQTKITMVVPIFALWHHQQRVVRANIVNQGVCNHHHLGNGGKKNNLRYTQVYGTLMILAIRDTHKQIIA